MDKKSKAKTGFKEKITAFFSGLPEAMKKLIYPDNLTCDLCGEELLVEARYHVCGKCIEELPFIEGNICLNCGVSIDNEAQYCDRCQRMPGVYKINRAPLLYEGKAIEMIHGLKFGGKKYLVDTISAMMADTFLKYGMEGEIIVPVPMTAKDEKKRGFNQAELIAYKLGERLNIPVLPALSKIKETSMQKELSGKERQENLSKAFEVVYPQVKDRKILLIDDIFTTGATINECARALLKAKCKEVSALTACITKLKPLME